MCCSARVDPWEGLFSVTGVSVTWAELVFRVTILIIDFRLGCWNASVIDDQRSNKLEHCIHGSKRYEEWSCMSSHFVVISYFRCLRLGSPPFCFGYMLSFLCNATNEINLFVSYFWTFSGWRGDVSSRLRSLLPGFDSGLDNVWFEFVGSLLCSEWFFSRRLRLSPLTKNNVLIWFFVTC